MNKLSNNNVRYVYQIADIHIPKNANRNEEYMKVIDKLVNKLDEGLVVICGDIFHDGLSGDSIILMKDIIGKINEKCDIIIFRGNHDITSKSNKKAIDNLKANLYKMERNNKIHLLEKTGEYEYGNIIFGYTDVCDEKIYKISKKYNKKIKIGLWHGTVNQSNGYNNHKLTSKINIKDFDGYDYVLLGDIHKKQYLKTNIAYSGSLIQQNHGEDIKDHGMIKWDLNDGTNEFIEIENEYGYVTIRVKDNVIEPYNNIPKNVRLKIIYEETTVETIKKIKDDIKKVSNIISCEERHDNIKIMQDGGKKSEYIDVINDDSVAEKLVEYVKKNNIITNDKIKMMNDEIINVLKEVKYNYLDEIKSIKLKYLIFNNMYVFGTENCIDYEQFKGIINICGGNGMGKSSATINILLYAIFGTTETKGRSQIKSINNKKKSISTVVELEVNEKTYKISRRVRIKGKQMKNIGQTLILYENNKDISGKTVTMTNELIKKIIGNREDLLNTCILDQNSNGNFLTLSGQEKEKKISCMMKLDVYDKIVKNLESKVRNTNAVIENKKEIIYNVEGEENEDIIVKKINKLTNDTNIQDDTELDNIKETIIKKRNEYETFNKIFEEKNDINDFECKNEEEYKKEVKNINTEMKKVKNKIKDCVLTITSFGNIKEKNNLFEMNKKKRISEIEKKIHKLYKSRIGNDEIEIEYDIDKKIKNMGEENNKFEKKNEILDEENTKYKEYIKKNNTEKNKEKYNEYKKIIEKKKIIEEEIIEMEKTFNKLSKEFKKKYEGKYDKIIERKQYINGFINEHSNIENEYEEYIKQKNEKLTILTDERDELIKKHKRTNEVKETDSKNEILKRIKKNKEKIKEIDLEQFEKNKEINKKFIQMNEELINLRKYYDKIKNHKYNEKCEICMSNQLTLDKIEKEKEIGELEKKIVKLKKKSDLFETENKILIENNRLNELIFNDNKILDNIIDIEFNKSLDLKIEEIKNECNKINNSKMEYYDEYIEYKKELKNIDIKMNEYNMMTSKIDNIKKNIEEKKNIIGKLKNDIKKNKESYENYEKVIEYDEKIKNNKQMIKENELSINNNRIKINEYMKQKKDYEKYLSICKQNILIDEQIKNSEKELENEKENKNYEYEKYEETKKIKDNLEKILYEQEIKLKNIKNIIDKYEQYKIYKKNNEEIIEKNREYTIINKRIIENRENKLRYEKEKGQLENELKNIKKCTDEIKEKDKINIVRKNIINVIRNGYIDELMNKNILPAFEEKINSILRNYVKYQLRIENEGKNIIIHKDNDGLLSDANKMSGYETLMANIAFRIAINEFCRREKMSFMILDEAFSFCDNEAVDRLQKLFTYLKEKYTYVIVITHNDQIKSYTDKTIEIIKEENLSKITNVNDSDRKKELNKIINEEKKFNK